MPFRQAHHGFGQKSAQRDHAAMTGQSREAVRATGVQACHRQDQCDGFDYSVLQRRRQAIVDHSQDLAAMAGWGGLIYHLSGQDEVTNQPYHQPVFTVAILVLYLDLYQLWRAG